MHYRNNDGTPVKQKCQAEAYTILTSGTRMSGDMWTSLCNGFSNYVNVAFTMHEAGIRDYSVLCEGDDGIIACNVPNAITSEQFEDLGFKIKIVPHDSIFSTAFCGCRLEPTTHTIMIAPDSIQGVAYSTHSKHYSWNAKNKLE